MVYKGIQLVVKATCLLMVTSLQYSLRPLQRVMASPVESPQYYLPKALTRYYSP